MTRRHSHLLIIDPQNDFCDLPAEHRPADPLVPGGTLQPQLPVPGAHADMLRLADFITAAGRGLGEITITLDSHHRVGIERPAMWRQADGTAVGPFTQVSADDVRAGRIVPGQAQALPRVLAYLDALEAGGRYRHMVWPAHCEIGTWGHNVHAAVRAAYNAWEERELGIVRKVIKGTNPWTEHYSAVMAEVPDPDDPGTQLNRALIDRLAHADRILIAGEAGSHCVKATTEHLAEHLPAGSVRKMVLLRDCISPVAGFEPQYRAFIQEMAARGLQVSTSDEAMGELLAGSA